MKSYSRAMLVVFFLAMSTLSLILSSRCIPPKLENRNGVVDLPDQSARSKHETRFLHHEGNEGENDSFSSKKRNKTEYSPPVHPVKCSYIENKEDSQPLSRADQNSSSSRLTEIVPPVSVSTDNTAETILTRTTTNQTVTTRITKEAKEKETVHVLYCLSGNLKGFIDEFEVSLKSVLMNSPLDYDLTIHIMVDELAHAAATERILGTTTTTTTNANLEGSLWRNKISIQFYLVTEQQSKIWMEELAPMIGHKPISLRVTIGTYFRLFANRVLPKGTGNVIYMDTDVVIIANLQQVWQHVIHFEQDDHPKHYAKRSLFMMGYKACAGFMVFNVDRFHQFWDWLKRIPLEQIEFTDDQYLLNAVRMRWMFLTRNLPLEWSVDLSNMKLNPHEIMQHRPSGFGYLHFNGLRPNSESFWHNPVGLLYYCDRVEECKHNETEREKFRQTWNLAEYYIKQPWELTKYLGKSMAAPGTAGERLSVMGGKE